MNTKYTEIFLFLSRLSRKNNKGFAMAFCLTVGVVLAATGTAMLVRSSNENKSVKAQENTARASAKADVAVTRLVYFLNQPQHRELITKSLNEWEGFGSSNNQGNNNSSDDSEIQGVACDDDSDSDSDSENSSSENPDSQEVDTAMLENLLAQNWIPVDSSDSSAGDYRLRDYCLVEPETIGGERKCPTNPTIPDDPDRVWLQVEARAVNHGTDELKTNNSVRAVEAMIPINKPASEEEASDLPGLWVSDTSNGSGGSQDNSKQSSGSNKPINAVTWIDCSQKSEWNSNSSYVNDSKLDLTPIIMGSTSLTPPDEVKQVKDDLPSVPSIPSSGVKNMGSRDWSDCYATLPRGVNGNSSTCSVGSGTDTPVGNIYYYKFTGDDSIKLSNAQIRINPPEGKKVVIHITGGITMSGTGKNHGAPASCQGTSEEVATYIGDPDDPSKLEIYSHSNSKPIDISDTTMISAFVHAPKTELKISQAQVRGAAWFKKMDASNSGGGSSGCERSIKQMDVGKTLVTGGESGESESKQTLGSIIGYRSLEAN